jgi:hypothetical protein
MKLPAASGRGIKGEGTSGNPTASGWGIKNRIKTKYQGLHFEVFLHGKNLQNRCVMTEVPKHHVGRNGLRMKSAEQETFHNKSGMRSRSDIRKRTYIKCNMIKTFGC